MLSKTKTHPMKTFIVSILLLIVTNNFGQELNLPTFTQYLADNPFVVAPTFAGIGDNVRIRANGLTQWVGIKNAPDNASIYADMRIADRSGLGLSFYSDKNGFTRQTGAKFSFAQHIILDEYSNQFLSFGLSYNFNNFRIETDKFDTSIFDPSVVNDRYTVNNNFDVALLYRNKGYFMSFNAANVLNKDILKFRGFEPKLLRNYQVYTGYVYQGEGNNKFEIEPSAFFQYYESDGRSNTDLNVKFRQYNDNDDYYWGGISYRFLNDQLLKPLMLGPMAGFKKSGFYFGYSYQVTFNEFSAYNSGTHVVTLGFDFFQGLSNCPCTKYLSKD
jgi:type IX secretion system PorP/SprF family membrane protein